MKKRASLWVLPLLAASAFAQDNRADDGLPEVRHFTVEMIIFSYGQNVSAGSEIFVPDTPPVEGLLPDENRRADKISVTERNRYEFVTLRRKDFQLLDAYGHLRRLGAYKPLMHFGWTQATYPNDEVLARPLSSFATPPHGLEGDLTLYLNRYLHLAINLQLDAPSANVPGNTVPRNTYYRIEEDRIFKNGEIRYFDHPKFGALVKITRVEEEEPRHAELLGDGEMLGD